MQPPVSWTLSERHRAVLGHNNLGVVESLGFTPLSATTTQAVLLASDQSNPSDQQGDQIVIIGNKKHEMASARRRLIRGSFAAPAVLALHSGSAIAASSHVRCIINQVENPTTAVVPWTQVDDGFYVRVQLHGHWESETKVGRLDKVKAYYLQGSVIDAKISTAATPQPVNLFLTGSTSWRKISLGTGGAIAEVGPSGASPGNYLQLVPRFVALRIGIVTVDGIKTPEVRGLVDGNSGSAITAKSCWSSFAGVSM